MNRALWFLLGLRLKSWLRRLGRNLRTVRGVLLTGIFSLMSCFWLGSMVVQAVTIARQDKPTETSLWVEQWGPWILLLYCLWSVIGRPQQSPLNFTLPEVQFLFAGPFSRRQILIYKLLSQTLLIIPVSLFLSIAGRSTTGTWLGGWIGIFLILNFIQLFTLAFALLTQTIDARAYTRLRQAIVWTVLLSILLSLGSAWWALGGFDDPQAVLERVQSSTVVQVGLAPLRWFFRITSARQLDAYFVLHTVLAVLVLLGLLVLVVRLDSHYLEAAAGAAERRAAVLEQIRRGGLAAAFSARPGASTRTPWPTPPWLGGVGPILWRQLIGASRGYRVLFVLLFATLISVGAPLVATLASGRGANSNLPWIFVTLGLIVSVMLDNTVTFDFRADLDRIEFLKTLPLASWQVALAEILAPTILLSLYQIAFASVVFAIFGEIGWLVAAVVVLSWPVNLLLVGVENGIFLLFPTRMAPAAPGDFSQAFRQMFTMLAKALALALGLGTAAISGALVYRFIDGRWALAVLAAAIPASVLSMMMVPIVAWAFERFDVSRDLPP